MPFFRKNKVMNQKAVSEKRERTVQESVPVTGKKRLLSYQVANLQGIGSRERQEDSFSIANAFDVMEIKEKGLLFVVCDGMGGMKDGRLASETAVASIRDSFLAMDRKRDIAGQLKESIFLAADEVRNRLDGAGGSTVVAGIIFDERLYYASVGDSYLYLRRGNDLYRLNREQNLCHEKYLESIRSGNLNPREAEESQDAAALTQFLGMVGFCQVDCSVRPLPLREGDVLLACSDGVGAVLDEREIWNALNFSSTQAMCQQLEQGIFAHAKKNQDNYTALAVKCMF
ncbi:MAG: serine/threonine-protein phosphatase [Lachnospiraceae bacterium]|nr:serine/threonine-protein phosphatase [Lachnospiraceae bacterium]